MYKVWNSYDRVRYTYHPSLALRAPYYTFVNYTHGSIVTMTLPSQLSIF